MSFRSPSPSSLDPRFGGLYEVNPHDDTLREGWIRRDLDRDFDRKDQNVLTLSNAIALSEATRTGWTAYKDRNSHYLHYALQVLGVGQGHDYYEAGMKLIDVNKLFLVDKKSGKMDIADALKLDRLYANRFLTSCSFSDLMSLRYTKDITENCIKHHDQRVQLSLKTEGTNKALVARYRLPSFLPKPAINNMAKQDIQQVAKYKFGADHCYRHHGRQMMRQYEARRAETLQAKKEEDRRDWGRTLLSGGPSATMIRAREMLAGTEKGGPGVGSTKRKSSDAGEATHGSTRATKRLQRLVGSDGPTPRLHRLLAGETPDGDEDAAFWTDDNEPNEVEEGDIATASEGSVVDEEEDIATAGEGDDGDEEEEDIATASEGSDVDEEEDIATASEGDEEEDIATASEGDEEEDIATASEGQ